MRKIKISTDKGYIRRVRSKGDGVMSIHSLFTYALFLGAMIIGLSLIVPDHARAYWSETETFSNDYMDFTVARDGGCGRNPCEWSQCYDCGGGHKYSASNGTSASDSYLYQMKASTCPLVTEKNLGRTPLSYHPRLRIPVNVTTGNLAYQETDFRVKTPGLPITFTRTWNSQGGLDEDLGDGWMHSYGWYVDSYGDYVLKVVQGDGRTHCYNCQDANENYESCDGDDNESPVYVAHPPRSRCPYEPR